MDPAPLSPWRKKTNLGQDQHPGPAWMGAQVGRGAARPSSIPGRWELAAITAAPFHVSEEMVKPPLIALISSLQKEGQAEVEGR